LKENRLQEENAEIWNSYLKSLQGSFVTLSDQADQLTWSLNTSETYEPKFGYKVLAQDNREDPQILSGKKLWKLKCPAKTKIFMSLLINNKALTWDKLQKISYESPGRCYLCKQENETNSHLILFCNYSSEVW
jgi:hypothetical protein